MQALTIDPWIPGTVATIGDIADQCRRAQTVDLNAKRCDGSPRHRLLTMFDKGAIAHSRIHYSTAAGGD